MDEEHPASDRVIWGSVTLDARVVACFLTLLEEKADASFYACHLSFLSYMFFPLASLSVNKVVDMSVKIPAGTDFSDVFRSLPL